jgi:transcriptional regulator with XRE-family HTH domain
VPYPFFGINLRYHRRRAQLTQAELASRAELTQSHLSKLERGLSATDAEQARIAAALNVTPDVLLAKPRIVRHSDPHRSIVIVEAR